MKRETEHLKLVPLSVDTIDALIASDTAELLHATGARFPAPFELPPLFDRDTLTRMREQLERGSGATSSYLLLLKDTGEPVGIAGFNPSGDADTMLIGYSIYPHHEGKGYATEAARALIDDVLDERISIVRATIPPDHDASIRVAEKVGMRKAGTTTDVGAGEVLVLELQRPREP